MMCKVIMSQPIAAAARVVELCRTFDNMGDIFVAFSVPLPLAVKEVILAECLRVCLLRNDKTLRPEQEGIAALNHANACAFLGKFVAANEALDLYVAFLYVAQVRCQGIAINPCGKPMSTQISRSAIFVFYFSAAQLTRCTHNGKA